MLIFGFDHDHNGLSDFKWLSNTTFALKDYLCALVLQYSLQPFYWLLFCISHMPDERLFQWNILSIQSTQWMSVPYCSVVLLDYDKIMEAHFIDYLFSCWKPVFSNHTLYCWPESVASNMLLVWIPLFRILPLVYFSYKKTLPFLFLTTFPKKCQFSLTSLKLL